MKLIKYRISKSADELISFLSDNDAVNKNVNVMDKKGMPCIHLNRKGEAVIMRCEFKGGATKDNAFISGTTFRGKVVEKDGYTELRGMISTAPIFHFVLFSMLVASVVMCIINMTFNAVPICLVIFDVFMYKDEFRKQGIIERYIYRAVKRLENNK